MMNQSYNFNVSNVLHFSDTLVTETYDRYKCATTILFSLTNKCIIIPSDFIMMNKFLRISMKRRKELVRDWPRGWPRGGASPGSCSQQGGFFLPSCPVDGPFPATREQVQCGSEHAVRRKVFVLWSC